MLEAQTGSFLGGGGMLREGLLQMAEEITLWAGMGLLSSEKKSCGFNEILHHPMISWQSLK